MDPFVYWFLSIVLISVVGGSLFYQSRDGLSGGSQGGEY